jgi:hypothetical protein
MVAQAAMGDNESLLSSTPAQAKPRKDDTWVQCDRCSKWRRIPQMVADGLDEDANWCGLHGRSLDVCPTAAFCMSSHFLEGCCGRSNCSYCIVSFSSLCCPCRRYCEHNPTTGFASCNIPQELSNDEIDRQLADSEVRSLYLLALVPERTADGGAALKVAVKRHIELYRFTFAAGL